MKCLIICLTIFMLTNRSVSAVYDKYVEVRQKLNPLLAALLDPAMKEDGNPSFLEHRFGRLFFDNNFGINGVFEVRNQGDEDKVPVFDRQWENVFTEDVVGKIAVQRFKTWNEFGKNSENCDNAVWDVFLDLETNLKEEIVRFFADLTQNTLMITLQTRLPDGNYNLLTVAKPDVSKPFNGAGDKVYAQIEPFIKCLNKRTAKGEGPENEYKALIERERKRGHDSAIEYERLLEELLKLADHLSEQFVVGLEAILLQYLSIRSYDLRALVFDYNVLTRAYYFLFYRMKLDKSANKDKYTLVKQNKSIANVFSNALKFLSEAPVNDRPYFEWFTLGAYGSLLEKLQIEGKDTVLTNLKTFWTETTGSSRGPTQKNRPEIATELEKILINQCQNGHSVRILTLGHEVLSYAAENADQLSREWLDKYISVYNQAAGNNGILPLKLGAITKIFTFKMVPNMNHRSVEINNQIWQLLDQFLNASPQVVDDPQSFPFRFDKFLDEQFKAKNAILSPIYPFIKIFNLWSSNAQRMLPKIDFANIKDGDISNWANELTNFAAYDDFKKMLQTLFGNEDSSQNFAIAIQKGMTWEQAVTLNSQIAGLLNTANNDLGSGKRVLNQLKI